MSLLKLIYQVLLKEEEQSDFKGSLHSIASFHPLMRAITLNSVTLNLQQLSYLHRVVQSEEERSWRNSSYSIFPEPSSSMS